MRTATWLCLSASALPVFSSALKPRVAHPPEVVAIVKAREEVYTSIDFSALENPRIVVPSTTAINFQALESARIVVPDNPSIDFSALENPRIVVPSTSTIDFQALESPRIVIPRGTEVLTNAPVYPTANAYNDQGIAGAIASLSNSSSVSVAATTTANVGNSSASVSAAPKQTATLVGSGAVSHRAGMSFLVVAAGMIIMLL
jgi:hypothetical protein